jgi:uracil-DNA glycosylase
MKLIQEGPRRPGGVMLVGEAPGEREVEWSRPFAGPSGQELNDILGKTGWQRGDFFITNVCHERPPGNDIEKFFAKKGEAKHATRLDGQLLTAVSLARLSDLPLAQLGDRYPRGPILFGLQQLQRDIDVLRPRLIIAMGNTALWALTGHTGIRAWRGSIIPAAGGPVDGYGTKLIPTIHTASVIREYQWKSVVVQDFKRARRESGYEEIRTPAWEFTVPSTIGQLEQWIVENVDTLPPEAPVAADVENDYTTDRAHDARILCLGISTSSSRACCVPMVHRTGPTPHWWATAAEERDAVLLLRKVLTSRPVIFHNGLHDCQVIAHNWGYLPRFEHDTMVGQHTLFPAQLGGKIDPITGRTSKSGSSYSLLFCSSMYCHYHKFWKDDGKGWDPSVNDELQYWHYNCTDLVRTYEVWEAEQQMLAAGGLTAQYEFLMSLFPHVFEMMFGGLGFDNRARMKYRFETKRQVREIQAWVDEALGHPLDVRSNGKNGQMQKLFYGDFGLPPVLHRKTKQPTLDDGALDGFKKKMPILRPLIERIQAIRTLELYKANFLDLRLSPQDKRLRFALNVAGPETYRFSSNTTALGEGTNLQNLPRMED